VGGALMVCWEIAMRFEKDSWTLAIILVFSQLLIMIAVMLTYAAFVRVNRGSIFLGVLLSGLARPFIQSKLTGVPLRFSRRP